MPKDKNPEQTMNFFLGGIKQSLENIEKTLDELCKKTVKIEEQVDDHERRVTVIETKFLVYAGILGVAM